MESSRPGKIAVFAPAAALLLLAGAFLIVLAIPYDVMRGYLDSLADDGSAEPYTRQLHCRLRLCSILAAAALGGASATVFLGRHRLAHGASKFAHRVRFDVRVLYRYVHWHSHGSAFWVLTVTIVAASIRLWYIDEPMRYDESHTFVNYAAAPWFITISRYDAPNNHVFHSLCVHFVTRIAGDSPLAIRLTAFIAGVLLVPACFLFGAVVENRRTGLLAAMLVAVTSQLVEYSTNARGYTLHCLLVVVCLSLAGLVARRDNVVAWGLLTGLTAIGFWTIPTMLYPFSMLLAWLLLQRGWSAVTNAKGRAFGWYPATFAGGAVLISLLLYLPALVVSGPNSLVAGGRAEAQSLAEFLAATPAAARACYAWMTRDMPVPVQLLVTAGLLGFLVLGSPPARRIRLMGLVALFSCAALLFIQRIHPPTRVWSFMLAPILVFSSAGLIRIRGLFSESRLVSALTAAVGLGAVAWMLGDLVTSDSIRTTHETGTLRDAEAIVRYLRERLEPGEPVVAIAPSSAPLIYYARRLGVPPDHFGLPGVGPTRDDRAIVVVNKAHPQTLEEVLAALDLQTVFPVDSFAQVTEYSTATLYRSASDDASRPALGIE